MTKRARRLRPSTVALSAEGAEKAAEFVNFCDAFSIPVLTLTNVTGYKATKCQEKRIAKAAAKLIYAFHDMTDSKGKCNRRRSKRNSILSK